MGGERAGVGVTTSAVARSPLGAGGALVLGQDQDVVGGGFEASQAFSGALREVEVVEGSPRSSLS